MARLVRCLFSRRGNDSDWVRRPAVGTGLRLSAHASLALTALHDRQTTHPFSRERHIVARYRGNSGPGGNHTARPGAISKRSIRYFQTAIARPRAARQLCCVACRHCELSRAFRSLCNAAYLPFRTICAKAQSAFRSGNCRDRGRPHDGGLRTRSMSCDRALLSPFPLSLG